jgi:hypothetical protein
MEEFLGAISETGLYPLDNAKRSAEGLIGIYCENGGWPSTKEIVGAEKDEEFDIIDVIKEYLAPGSVAILMDAGKEGRRYLIGIATSLYNNPETGEIELNQIDLDDIYAPFHKRGIQLTACER